MEQLQLKMSRMMKVGGSLVSAPKHQQTAPHPIPKGKEGLACPITGMFLDGDLNEGLSAKEARARLDADPDIALETLMLKAQSSKDTVLQPSSALVSNRTEPTRIIPLNVINRAHRSSPETRQLVRAVGGLPTLRAFTTLFYKRCFADPHIDKFIRSHNDPHGERFALWVAEKMGDGTPWSEERKTRPETLMRLNGEVVRVAFDRSSAHFAAWFSPKREPSKRGDHFKPDDARVWMRLHFWAAREVGLFEHEAFMDYYIRFIGHFISVYSSKSPPFTRESARWSADPENVRRYLASGNVMSDVIDAPIGEALSTLPISEQLYTGSGHPNPSWPYDMPPLR